MLDGPTFQSYYLGVGRMVSARLAKERPEYLSQVGFEEYLDYLVNECSWETLELDEGSMTMEPFIGRMRIRDYGETVEVDQPRVRLRIPVHPHPQRSEFLRLMPSSQRLSGEPQWHFEGDTLVVECGADETSIQRALDEVRFWIGGRNNDVRHGNATIRQTIEPIWRNKREELQRHSDTINTLVGRVKIPLHQSRTAPKPIPIPRRQSRTEKPVIRAGDTEPVLDRDSVLEIVKFIEVYSRQLEVTPRVYSSLKEEDLRDLVLSLLNVNYPGSSGETFSKRGKTDLLLRIGEGSLVGECKRWKGAKQYASSLDQLFGYLTWRHSYGVLLTFSTNKDMSACIQSGKDAIAEHETTVAGSVTGGSDSRFASRHLHPQDRAKQVEVFHLFADLSVL